MAETEAPDLILMDLMMPEKNGMDACRRFAEELCFRHQLTAKGEENRPWVWAGDWPRMIKL
jgi:CheY-like chemotaxis protein